MYGKDAPVIMRSNTETTGGLETRVSEERRFRLFLIANVLIGFGTCVDSSAFNNYLREIYHLDVTQRTLLEFPRETPGFLVFVFMGMLSGLGDVRIAAIAQIITGLGMFTLGVIPPEYALMLACVFFYSTGIHLYLPLTNSIGMSFARDGKVGRKLGEISAANTVALVSGSAILLILFRFFKLSFMLAFSLGACAFLAAGVMLFCMGREKPSNLKQRFVFRKEYRLYYWLSVLYGARKQIFITFAPWVIVDVFKQPVTTMTLLFFIVSVLGIVVKPLIGRLIDTAGERFTLGLEAVILICVCLLYAFAADIFPASIALVVVCICYVIDQCSTSVSMARATYMRRIALSPEDVSPSLSLGVSIDHIVSMFLPILGGIVWKSGGQYGYRYVFIGGAVVALVNFISTRFIVKRY